MNEVDLSVKADIAKALDTLGKLGKQMSEIGESFSSIGKEVDKEFNDNAKKTETYLDSIASMARRLKDRIVGDFKSLVSLESLSSGLKLSNQFKGSIEQTVDLSNSIRKLGSVFGIAEGDFSSFQTMMTKGLGEIGLASDVAARTLEGLAETPVRGQKNLLEYSKTAGQLASVGREKGKEGDIAKSLARVIQARGGNVNDTGQMKAVAQSVLAVQRTTGASPSQTLATMERLFTGMSSDFRKSISTQGLAKLSGAGAVAGPNATAFIESFLKMGKTQRAGLEARGMGNLFGDQGFNPDQIKKFAAEAEKLGGGDIRVGLKAMGIESDEAAEGFLRLRDNLDAVVAAQKKISGSTEDLSSAYSKSLGMGEAFNASINRVKSMVAGPLSSATQGLTGVLGGASQSDAGAALTVGAGGLLATMLAGGGLRGIKGMAQAKAEESITGEKVIPVRVVNVQDFGGAGGPLSKVAEAAKGAGGIAGKLGKGAGVLGAGMAGYEIGEQVLNPLIDSMTQGKTSEGFEGNAVERLFFKLDKLLGGETSAKFQQSQKVLVELKSKDLKEARPGSRGGSN